ncbi:glycosyltransferase family 2 protein [Sphingobacterium thermophilum]|uniref:Glycosyltransferase 2-like domain-containing protein n=1 Tax=Sphingobacterium thermophilum TaxID=768534 RepID=A0ABP8R0J5_9SPHI
MKVSFVLPAYKAKFLPQAIESILRQDYTNFELIVVDDASPENLLEIVNSYNDPRIKYYRNQQNIGRESLVKQWNHSIRHAEGDYLVLAADDDTYSPNYLSTMIQLANKFPEVDVFRGRVREIDEHDNILELDGLIPEYCTSTEFLYHWKRATILICIGNYMFRTKVIQEKGFVDFPSAFCTDITSIYNISTNGVCSTMEFVFNFRRSNIHLSGSNTQLEKKLEANNQFYQWLFDLKFPSPTSRDEAFMIKSFTRREIYIKCRYDFYNQVYKWLPLTKLGLIKRFRFLSLKDRMMMIVRYFFDRIFK